MEDLIPGTATNDEGMNQLRSTRDVLRDKHPLGKPHVKLLIEKSSGASQSNSFC